MVYEFLTSLAFQSVSFLQDPLDWAVELMDEPSFYLWDILIGLAFIGLGVLLFFLGVKRASSRTGMGRLAHLAAFLLGVVLILLGILIGINGFYTMFVIY